MAEAMKEYTEALFAYMEAIEKLHTPPMWAQVMGQNPGEDAVIAAKARLRKAAEDIDRLVGMP